MALRGWRPVSSGAASASAILWVDRAGGSLSWCSCSSSRLGRWARPLQEQASSASGARRMARSRTLRRRRGGVAMTRARTGLSYEVVCFLLFDSQPLFMGVVRGRSHIEPTRRFYSARGAGSNALESHLQGAGTSKSLLRPTAAGVRGKDEDSSQRPPGQRAAAHEPSGSKQSKLAKSTCDTGRRAPRAVRSARRPAPLRGPRHHHGQGLCGSVDLIRAAEAHLRRGDGGSTART